MLVFNKPDKWTFWVWQKWGWNKNSKTWPRFYWLWGRNEEAHCTKKGDSIVVFMQVTWQLLFSSRSPSVCGNDSESWSRRQPFTYHQRSAPSPTPTTPDGAGWRGWWNALIIPYLTIQTAPPTGFDTYAIFYILFLLQAAPRHGHGMGWNVLVFLLLGTFSFFWVHGFHVLS